MPQDPGWWPWIFCDWFGGKLFDGHKVTFATDPRNVAAYAWIQSFTQFYGLDNVKALSSEFGPWASPAAPFFTGKIAMVFQGVWYDNYIHQYKPGLDYGVGPWPENVPGMKDFAMVEADVLTIPRGAKHPREAWEFIKYLNSANPMPRRAGTSSRAPSSWTSCRSRTRRSGSGAPTSRTTTPIPTSR